MDDRGRSKRGRLRVFLCTCQERGRTRPAVSPWQRPHGLFLCSLQCYTRPHHPRDCYPTPDRRGNPLRRWCRDLGVFVSLTLSWAAAPLDVLRRRKGERMTEGTLSIVRRGIFYQVRYASNNVHDRDRLPCVCPDEARLAALLRHCGTESAVIAQVCADVRHGKMAVLLVVVSAEQLQACFPPTPQANARARSAGHASVSLPDADVLRQDAPCSSSRPPGSQALWGHAREARAEAEKLHEEFALLLEEAALLLEETALMMGASHQLLEECHK